MHRGGRSRWSETNKFMAAMSSPVVTQEAPPSLAWRPLPILPSGFGLTNKYRRRITASHWVRSHRWKTPEFPRKAYTSRVHFAVYRFDNRTFDKLTTIAPRVGEFNYPCVREYLNSNASLSIRRPTRTRAAINYMEGLAMTNFRPLRAEESTQQSTEKAVLAASVD